MSTKRRFHTDSRLSENFTEQGLASLTGQDPEKWDRYVLKELLDNSLEAVEESVVPNVGVYIQHFNDTNKYGKELVRPARLIVQDSGDGISEDRVSKIFKDVSKFGGTKRHYNLPTRGNIGNALMTILGIETLQDVPLVVRSKSKKHTIKADIDTVSDIPEIDIDTGSSRISGTEVVTNISGLKGDMERIEETLASFIALNPHVNFTISLEGEDGEEKRKEYRAVTEFTGDKFNLPRGATTGKANWFSYDDFKERLKADARAEKGLTVWDFIKEFWKLSSRPKRKQVLEGTGLNKDMTVYELANIGDSEVRTLYENMVEETRQFNPSNLDSTLGCIGKDLKQGLLRYLDFIGEKENTEKLAEELSGKYEDINSIDDLLIYYGGGDVIETDEKDIPYYFEIATVPMNDDSNHHSSTVKFGINRSIAYSNPRIWLGDVEHLGGKTGYGRGIRDVFQGSGHGYYVLANLTCPNLTYLDRGKQNFETEPFRDGIGKIVGRAVRKVEREFRSKLNKLWEDETETHERKLANKAPKGFVKNFVFNNFNRAYNEGTEEGRLTITMRQLFYIMRPWFQELKERYGYKWNFRSSFGHKEPLELKYGTFRSNIDKYEKERLGERLIHRDKRGFFVEPHTNRQVDLETASIEKYKPDLEQFNNLLFVEKAGFFKQIHQDFELTKKYDIGLINARGFNVIAGKDLIEKIQRETDCTLYTLTDLDLHGVGIAEKAGEPDALSEFMGKFDTERLGLRLEDVKEYNLPIEKKEYSQDELSEIENMVLNGKMTREEAEFFRENQRVEVNALRPAELEKYLIRRLEEEGVEKVKPEEEDIDEPEIESPDDIKEEATEKAVGSFVMDEAGKEIIKKVEDEGVDYDESFEEELKELSEKGKEGVLEKIHEELKKKPPKHWTDIEREKIKEREGRGKKEKEKLDREVTKSVYDWCKKNVSVQMRLKVEGDDG